MLAAAGQEAAEQQAAPPRKPRVRDFGSMPKAKSQGAASTQQRSQDTSAGTLQLAVVHTPHAQTSLKDGCVSCCAGGAAEVTSPSRPPPRRRWAAARRRRLRRGPAPRRLLLPSRPAAATPRGRRHQRLGRAHLLPPGDREGVYFYCMYASSQFKYYPTDGSAFVYAGRAPASVGRTRRLPLATRRSRRPKPGGSAPKLQHQMRGPQSR